MNHLNQTGISFSVSPTPQAEQTTIRSSPFLSANEIIFLITFERKVGGVLNFDQGKSDFREMFNALIIPLHSFIAFSMSEIFYRYP